MDNLSNANNDPDEDDLIVIDDSYPLCDLGQEKTLIKPSQYSKEDIKVNDYQTLEDGALLNDTIISFYLNYLYGELSESLQESIHIFSTYFYTSLKCGLKNDLGKNLSEDERSYLKVKGWTKKIDIFSKRMLVIPIHEVSSRNFWFTKSSSNSHWYLIIVCNHGMSATEDDEKKSQGGNPSLIVFDSLAETRVDAVEKIKAYLKSEHFERKGLPFNNAKEISPAKYPDIPIQTNDRDCGVYLLHYAELIFQDPLKFLAPNLPDLSNWFTQREIMNKRRKIADDIKRIAESQNTPMDLFPDIKFPSPIKRPESPGVEESHTATSERKMDPNTSFSDESDLEERQPTEVSQKSRPDKRTSTEPDPVPTPKKFLAGKMFQQIMKYTKTLKLLDREENIPKPHEQEDEKT